MILREVRGTARRSHRNRNRRSLPGWCGCSSREPPRTLGEKIKAVYGIDIPDRGLLQQIVETAKQSFGGNLDVAIRSPQIRDLIELYAMSTGQGTSRLPPR